jgi:hypothetical protein
MENILPLLNNTAGSFASQQIPLKNTVKSDWNALETTNRSWLPESQRDGCNGNLRNAQC